MSGTAIIIIVGGGGSPRTADQGVSYPVDVGDGVQNTNTSGPAIQIDYTNGTTQVTSKVFLGAQETVGFLNVGSVVVP